MMRKSIVFIGKTGSGKSTVSTILQYGCMRPENNAFKINDSVKGVTTKCVRTDNRNFIVYDTVGLGEADNGAIPHEKAVHIIKDFVKGKGFDYICIVKNSSEKLDMLDMKVLKEIKEIFPCSNDRIICLFTRCSTSWLQKERKNLQKIYGIVPMHAVDFPLENKKYEQVYAQMINNSLAGLKKWLTTLNYTHKVTLPNMREGINYKFIRHTFGKEGYYIGKIHYVQEKLGQVLITNSNNNNNYWYIDGHTKDIQYIAGKKNALQLCVDPREYGNVILVDKNECNINVKIEYVDTMLRYDEIQVFPDGNKYKFIRNTIAGGCRIGKVFYVKKKLGSIVITCVDNRYAYWHITNSLDISLCKEKTVFKLVIDSRYAGGIALVEYNGRSMNVTIEGIN